MTVPPSPELAILRFLASRTHAGAAEVGKACGMVPGEVRARLAAMESLRLVAGRQDLTASLKAPRRLFYVTGEGRRRAGISDARG